MTDQAYDVTVDLAAAVNNRQVLANCLLRSPDVAAGALTLRTYEGYASAAAAYNHALAESTADVLILVHQDVYLPSGFLSGLVRQLTTLNELDPNWALAGVMGLDSSGKAHGLTWSSGLGQVMGNRVTAPAQVETLDEMLLVIRRASGLSFDERMPSFHLYAADATQTAKARGQKTYVIDAPAIHHSRPVVTLDKGYRAAYRYMQRKWRSILPIPNLVCPITASPLTLILRDVRLRRRYRGKARPTEPQDDPSAIASRIGFERPAT